MEDGLARSDQPFPDQVEAAMNEDLRKELETVKAQLRVLRSGLEDIARTGCHAEVRDRAKEILVHIDTGAYKTQRCRVWEVGERCVLNEGHAGHHQWI